MPIREYVCEDCGHMSELLVEIGRNSDALQCKSCGSSRLETRLSVPSAPVIKDAAPHGAGSTCCGSNPSSQGCVPGSCCGS
ncbi:MAG: zinc ribbon domain-containing protein [Thermodesulfobacteriota bacterium]